jgi:hypothetical protein
MRRAEDGLPDSFWDVKVREQAEEDHFRREILDLQVQLETITKVELIRHAPGFQDFLKAIQARHALAREKLVGDGRLTNDGLREQRGRVKELESVLALLTKPQMHPELAQHLVQRKNQLAEALRRRPKPKTEDQPAEVKP